MPITIRNAVLADVEAIRTIRNHYIEHTAASLRTVPQTPQAALAWFAAHQGRYPVLAAFEGGADKLLGWGSLSPFRNEEGYAPTAELSVYVRPDALRRGIGRALMVELERRAPDCGLHCIVSVITADNAASIALHRSLGYTQQGLLPRVSLKGGVWRDVVFLMKVTDDSFKKQTSDPSEC